MILNKFEEVVQNSLTRIHLHDSTTGVLQMKCVDKENKKTMEKNLVSSMKITNE